MPLLTNRVDSPGRGFIHHQQPRLGGNRLGDAKAILRWPPARLDPGAATFFASAPEMTTLGSSTGAPVIGITPIACAHYADVFLDRTDREIPRESDM